MDLSRRRERELARLGEEAQSLWHRQRDVLGRAGDLLREAGRQAGDIGREEVYPRARASVESHLTPALSKWSKAPKKPEKNMGLGSMLLMAIGAAAVAVVSYAVWSTLRADDDLWVDADDDF
jgi:hypothetical protein